MWIEQIDIGVPKTGLRRDYRTILVLISPYVFICHIPNPVQATVLHRDYWNPKALSEWHQNGIRFEPTSGRDIEMMLLYPYILLEFQKRITPE